MPKKDERRLRIGVLGAGQIAQAAHFESCAKARNAELARHLRRGRRPARADGGDARRRRRPIADYDAMLADPEVDAVIVATADAFHVPASLAGARGRQARAVREADRRDGRGGRGAAQTRSVRSGKVLQVGHMKRFDPGIQAAKAFIADEMGALVALKAWYCDRPTATR